MGGQFVPTRAPQVNPQRALAPLAPSSNAVSKSVPGGLEGVGRFFDQNGYLLDTMRRGAPVPPVFARKLPNDMNNSVPMNKDVFLRLLLPLSIKVNAEIAAERATIELRALRSFVLRVNEAEPEGGRGDGADWRHRRRLEIGSLLRAGENHIAVEVGNQRGPGLLSLRAEGFALPGPWQVSLDGVALGAAIPADDTRPNPNAFGVEKPLEALVESRNSLLALFVVLLPLVYLLGLGVVSWRHARGRTHERALSALVAVERWAMVDVYFLGVLLVRSKVAGFAEATRLPGYLLLFLAAGLSVVCAARLRRVY